jgi:hypothetical protein
MVTAVETGRDDGKARLLAITGMHRSGTSLLARTLNLLGVSLGDPTALIPAGGSNIAGYWEPAEMTRVSDEVLARMGGSWDLPPVLSPGWEFDPILTEVLSRAQFVLGCLWSHDRASQWFAYKDPRASMLLPFWSRVQQPDRCVMAVRDPRAVAASLAVRDGIDEEWSAYLWLRHVCAVTRFTDDVFVVDYSTFFADPEAVLDDLVQHLEMSPTEKQRRAACDNVRPELRHHRPTWSPAGPLGVVAQDVYDGLQAGTMPPPQLRDEYASGLFLSEGDRQVRPALEVHQQLERVRRSVRRSREDGERWRRAVADHRRLHEEAESRAREADEAYRRDIAHLQDDVSRLEDDVRARRKREAATQRQLVTLTSRLRERDMQLRDAERRLRQVDKRFRKLTGSLRWRSGNALGEIASRLRGGRGFTIVDEILALLQDTGAPTPSTETGQPAAPARVMDRGQPRERPASSLRDVVVYTAVAGAYDDIHTPEVLPRGWRLVCFQDAPRSGPGIWENRVFDYFDSHPARRARYVKLHPHVYFPDLEWSIWVDANLLVRRDMTPLIEMVSTLDDKIAMIQHPHRRDVYEEGREVVARGLEDALVVDAQLSRCRDAGLATRSGLFETGVIIRHHRDARLVALANAWWKEIENGSHRDQLSLPFAARAAGVTISPLLPGGESVRNSTYFERFQHGAGTV